MSRMIGILSSVLLLGLIAVAAVVFAADMEGKIRAVDSSARTVELDDGTTIWLADGVATDALKEGAEVRVSYEERDGKKVATQIDVK